MTGGGLTVRLYNSTLSPINPIYDQNKNHQGKELANDAVPKCQRAKGFVFAESS